ncbi:MAG TPA: hypothetical protein VGR13_03990, partial [Actinomycetota bacterium]|nr:hypothetical protein [Actinomycetota bacterium]
RILDDLVAEAVNDHGDGVDAPEPFVQALLCTSSLPLLVGLLSIERNRGACTSFQIHVRNCMEYGQAP